MNVTIRIDGPWTEGMSGEDIFRALLLKTLWMDVQVYLWNWKLGSNPDLVPGNYSGSRLHLFREETQGKREGDEERKREEYGWKWEDLDNEASGTS